MCLEKQLDRNTMKLIASGKFLEINKSCYDQQQHTSFIDGAMFIIDFLNSLDRKINNKDSSLGGKNESSGGSGNQS